MMNHSRKPTIRNIMALAMLFSCLHGAMAACPDSEVRLDGPDSPFEGPGSPLSSSVIPRYDQGPLGICYAMTASALIDYHRIKVAGEEVLYSKATSPIDLAVMSRRFLAIEHQPIGIGEYVNVPIEALRHSSSKGFCPHPFVHDSVAQSMSTESGDGYFGQVSDEQYFGFLEKVFVEFKRYETYLSTNPAYTVLAPLEASNPDIRKVVRKMHEASLQRASEVAADWVRGWGARMTGFPNLNGWLGIFLESSPHDNSVYFFKKVLSRSCDGHRIAYSPIQPVVLKRNDARGRVNSNREVLPVLAREIDGKLCPSSGEAEPVGLAICSKVLRPGSNTTQGGPGTKGLKADGSQESFCAPHALLVVGRRKRGDKVEYLLRNSWGADACDDQYDALWPCENGDVWVGSDDLLWNTIDITHF